MHVTPLFHDLVLGGSVRVAIATLRGFDEERQDTIRVIARPNNAPKKMTNEDVANVFSTLGELKNLRRLELLNSSGPNKRSLLVLPAKALALALQHAQHLKDLDMVGVRLSGSLSDMEYLASSVLKLPSLKGLFITDLNITPGSASLNAFLHAACMNPGLEALAIRHTPWAGHALYSIDHRRCGLKSLRLTDAVYLQPIEWLHLIEGLQFNSTLKQLRITSSSVCPGLGAAVARLLVAHQVLDDVVIELASFADALPIGRSLMTNSTLKRLELLVAYPEPGANPSLVTDLFADAIRQNCTLEYFFLRTPHGSLTSPCLDFYLRLNRCGKRSVLEKPSKTLEPHDWVDALSTNYSDVSVLYYILQLNPALCQNQSGDREEASCLERKPKRIRVD